MTEPADYTDETRSRKLRNMPLPKRTKVLMEHFDLRPRPSLSQNFLVSEGAVDEIVSAVLDSSEQNALLIEIGAGLGALTVPLGESGRDLLAWETDPKLIEPLRVLTASQPNVQICQQDFTEVDLAELSPGRSLAICGNLPYHLSGLLLRTLMEAWARCNVIVVTVQSEVANRLMACPGDEGYGVLSVFAAYYLREVQRICNIGPGAFYPVPEVGSTAVAMYSVEEAEQFVGCRPPQDRPMLFDTIRGAFAHRRKTVRNSLALALPDFSKIEISHALQHAGVNPSIRAEKLDIEQFSRIADELTTMHTERDSDA